MFENILKLASKFNFLCFAGLREDMAERIMFSTLPSTVSLEHVSSTGGVVDYNALKWATDGRYNIIKYGLLACVDELEHLTKLDKGKAKHLFNLGQYKKCADYCFDKFQNNHWKMSFGGKAWAKIAMTLSHIIELDQQLKVMKELHDVDEEINIMKKIVVELNIFDGLSHNTASVMTSLLDEENKIEHPEWDLRKLDYDSKEYGDTAEKIQEKRESVQRLMDAKELENPKAVFTEIKDYLQEPYKYHDYIPKLKSNILRNDNLKSLAKIKIKKMILDYLPKLNELKNQSLLSKPIMEKSNLLYKYRNAFEEVFYDVQDIAENNDMSAQIEPIRKLFSSIDNKKPQEKSIEILNECVDKLVKEFI